ncbi:MAG: tRNA (N6-threonylcarbamoyladenosine(37)-N6)-methyltransferase TrmO [Muribaculaceae bacterium]
MRIIAHIRTEFGSKFGIPRQSGLVDQLRGRIVFEPEYRNADALRGIEGFSHLWLIWHFSQAQRQTWTPTVRPPRLGGNTRMGVFATRSPFRPNAIALSSVKLIDVDYDRPDSPAIIVAGADLMDGTPILDIKPYLPYTDCHPQATAGFTDTATQHMQQLKVDIAPHLAQKLPQETLQALQGALACDPRPRYHDDPERIYGMTFANHEVKFSVNGDTLKVVSIS